jgi:hypothetical protein
MDPSEAPGRGEGSGIEAPALVAALSGSVAPGGQAAVGGQAVTAEVFDLGPAASARSLAAGDDVFGLGSQEAPGRGEGAGEKAPTGVAAPAGPAAPGGQATTAPLRALGPRGDGNGADPFPDPAPERSRGLYLASLTAERIFSFDEAEAEPAPAPVAAPTAEQAAVLAPVAAPAEEPAAAPPAEEPVAAAAAPIAEPAAAPATVTLADLYLRQGHTEEAARMLGEIVEREPGNAAARVGLARLAGAPRPSRPARLDAAQLLAGLDDPQASPTVRRTFLLQSYLARLRQPRRPHVP